MGSFLLPTLLEDNQGKESRRNTEYSGGSRISRRGGVDLVGGGVDSRGGYVSKILYVKTKELGPLGGRAPGAPPPDPANGVYIVIMSPILL